jgi:hypothetical protein
MMKPYGCGLLRREIGRRTGREEDIVNGGNGGIIMGRKSRWMGLIMTGLKGDGRNVT